MTNPNRFNGMRSDRRKALELADLEMERDRQQLEQATAAQVRAILMRAMAAD